MALKPEHKIFIKHYVKTGNHIVSYQKAFPHADRKTAATNGGRLLKNAEIASAIQDAANKISKKAEEKAVEELKEEIKGEVLTALQKRDLLRRIAKGEEVNGKKPGVMEMLRAIELDNKMAGDNAPERKDLTTKGKELPAMTLVRTIEVVHTEMQNGTDSEDDSE